MLADKIIAQQTNGLITPREARRALRRAAKQCRFNADYSDTLPSYKRWDSEAKRADNAARRFK